MSQNHNEQIKPSLELRKPIPRIIMPRELQELKNYIKDLQNQIWSLWRLINQAQTYSQHLALIQLAGQLSSLDVQLRYYKVKTEDAEKFYKVDTLDYSTRLTIFNTCFNQFEEIASEAKKLEGILDLTFLESPIIRDKKEAQILATKFYQFTAKALAVKFYQFTRDLPRPELPELE